MVRAGLHCSFKMSRQMLPLLLIFGWNTFVLNATYKLPLSETRKKQRETRPPLSEKQDKILNEEKSNAMIFFALHWNDTLNIIPLLEKLELIHQFFLVRL